MWWQLRLQALELLKSEQKLEQIVRLIGPDALPPSQRLVLKVAEMIKNGFLQQNAFDDIDKYCSIEKQILILDLIMEYYRRADAVVKRGALLIRVTSLPVCDELVRIKMQYPNDQIDKIEEIRNRLDQQLGELERSYSGRRIS